MLLYLHHRNSKLFSQILHHFLIYFHLCHIICMQLQNLFDPNFIKYCITKIGTQNSGQEVWFDKIFFFNRVEKVFWVDIKLCSTDLLSNKFHLLKWFQYTRSLNVQRTMISIIYCWKLFQLLGAKYCLKSGKLIDKIIRVWQLKSAFPLIWNILQIIAKIDEKFWLLTGYGLLLYVNLNNKSKLW